MITNKELMAACSSALAEAAHRWLNDNRQILLRQLTETLKNPLPSASLQQEERAPAQNQYLTTADVAIRWKCCLHTVRRMIRSGKLTCLRLGRRHVLIPVAAVLKVEADAAC
jgi:excisionase family DNA binding protein